MKTERDDAEKLVKAAKEKKEKAAKRKEDIQKKK